MEISDPKHKTYGQWLKQEEAVSMTAPDPAIRAEVTAWCVAARGHGRSAEVP